SAAHACPEGSCDGLQRLVTVSPPGPLTAAALCSRPHAQYTTHHASAPHRPPRASPARRCTVPSAPVAAPFQLLHLAHLVAAAAVTRGERTAMSTYEPPRPGLRVGGVHPDPPSSPLPAPT